MQERSFKSTINIFPNLNTKKPPRITFSSKGNTNNSGTIVINSVNNPYEKRCLVIANGLGIVRTGIYQGDIFSISGVQCISK